MGEVYGVRGTKLELGAAVKVLLAVFTSEPARFEREANGLVFLDHSKECRKGQ